MNVALHTSGARLHYRHRAHDLLPALTAKRLTGLHGCATSVAEHDFLPRRFREPESRSQHTAQQQMIRKPPVRVQSKMFVIALALTLRTFLSMKNRFD